MKLFTICETPATVWNCSPTFWVLEKSLSLSPSIFFFNLGNQLFLVTHDINWNRFSPNRPTGLIRSGSRDVLIFIVGYVPWPCNFFYTYHWFSDCGRFNQAAARWQDQPGTRSLIWRWRWNTKLGGATNCIGREIWCLPYGAFFCQTSRIKTG